MNNLQEQTWTITQTFPARGLEKQTIHVAENRIQLKFKNIFQEWSYDYEYGELKPKVMKGRSGDSNWSSIGWWLIAIGGVGPLILNFAAPKIVTGIYLQILAIVFLLLGAMAFIMRFVKKDHVWFYEIDDSFAFGIPLYDNDRESREQAVEFIVKKIKLAQLQSVAKAIAKS